jgi:hypothetical protein
MQGLIIYRNRIFAGEATFAKEYVRSKIPEALSRVMMAEGGSQAPHPLHDSGKVNVDRPSNFDSIFRRLTRFRGYSSAANQGLRGHAAVVQTIAAQAVFFD